jgi:hypothetical protein
METSDARKRREEERHEDVEGLPESTADYIRRLCRRIQELEQRVAGMESEVLDYREGAGPLPDWPPHSYPLDEHGRFTNLPPRVERA